MKTVLVSGASGVVGYGILKSLRKNPGYKLIGTSIYPDSVAPAFCDIFERAPKTSNPEYIDWLCRIITKYNVDIIVPGIEIDMYEWARKQDVINRTGVKIVLNNNDLILLCEDKWNFYTKLHESYAEVTIDSKIHGTYAEISKAFTVPFLLKPRKGFASKGIVYISSEDDFSRHSDRIGSVLMAQPIVGDNENEYTTSAFFDNKSNLCCSMTLRRKLSKDGFTEKAQVVDLKETEKILQKLATIFKPIGPTNFQFRLHEGTLKILEINPRISSATSIRAAFGYNEAEMTVDYYLNGIIPVQPEIKKGVAIRYMEDQIFYDRDNF